MRRHDTTTDEQEILRSRLTSLRQPAGWIPDQSAGADREPLESAGESGLASLPDDSPLWLQSLLVRWSPRTLAMAAVVAICALVAGGFYLGSHRHATSSSSYADDQSNEGDDSDDASPEAASSSSAVGTADAGGSIVVDVSGKVRKPGLVTLPAGSRVADAIAAAGGARRPRDDASMDLASKVMDGQLLVVGPATSAPAASNAGGGSDPPSGSSAAAPIDLNQATIDQLETLPGVGPVTAQKILTWRTAHGGFTSVAQLQQVPGIGPAHFAEISPLVTA